MGIQSKSTNWPTAPRHLMSVSVKPAGNLWTRRVTNGLKRLTSLVWLSVIFTNVYTWKCLVSHDQTQSKKSLQGKDSENTCINEDLFYKERSFSSRNKCQFYATIKTPKPPQPKIHVILLALTF